MCNPALPHTLAPQTGKVYLILLRLYYFTGLSALSAFGVSSSSSSSSIPRETFVQCSTIGEYSTMLK